MGKLGLRLKHISVVARHEIINILDVLHLKSFLRRKLEKNTPVFREDFEISKVNKSVVVFPNIPWDYRTQRPQHIFKGLGKKNINVFYISPILSDKEYITQVDKNVYEVHLKSKEDLNILRDLKMTSELAKELEVSLKSVLKGYLSDSTVFFVLLPIWKTVIDNFKSNYIVYDMMDLYSGFPDAKLEIVQWEEELLESSDLVITTADSLYDFAKRFNSNVVKIKNGCDLSNFENIKENGLLDSLKKKPIVGYYGAITEWVDFEALKYVVKKNRDKYFVFLGSIDTNRARKLYFCRNVYFLGEVKHSELGGYLAYFDVCTIPFVLNDLIKSTNPVKFYEYISVGKPVVSSRFPELVQYEDICYLYDSKEEFDELIQKALESDSKDVIEKRKEVAQENTWNERVEEVVKRIQNI